VLEERPELQWELVKQVKCGDFLFTSENVLWKPKVLPGQKASKEIE